MPLPPPPGAEEEDGVVEWMLLRAAGRDLAADFGASGRMLPAASMKTMIGQIRGQTPRRHALAALVAKNVACSLDKRSHDSCAHRLPIPKKTNTEPTPNQKVKVPMIFPFVHFHSVF